MQETATNMRHPYTHAQYENTASGRSFSLVAFLAVLQKTLSCTLFLPPENTSHQFNPLKKSSFFSSRTHEEQLTDATLAQALSANPTLLTTLVEVCISPGRDLHPCSARFLLQRAPKLKRLGDIESWRVTLAEMKQLGEEMDKANSKCILTVLSFPPKEKHQYLF